MKKVLFATTALVASAGIASADGHLGVALSGAAEMGIIGGDRHGETQFWTDVDVTFSGSGETSGGLTFGFSVDLDESDDPDAFAGDDQGGETVFISGDFGTLTMGDTDGALDWALQEVAVGAGSIDDSHTFHAGYNGNSVLDGFDGKDGQIARYNHSIGDFAFAISLELDDSGADDPTFGVGAKYGTSFGAVDVGFGLGYQQASGPGFDSSAIGVSVDLTFAGGFRVVANYTEFDDVLRGGVATDNHFGIGASYAFDAVTVSANYGEFGLTGGGSDSGFGFAANYDLGGGAVVQFGYGSSDVFGAAGSVDSYSLGIAMSF